MTAPVASVIFPAILPVASCAEIGRLNKTRTADSVQAHCQRVERAELSMLFLPSFFPTLFVITKREPTKRKQIGVYVTLCRLQLGVIRLAGVLSDSKTGVNELLSFLMAVSTQPRLAAECPVGVRTRQCEAKG